MNIKNYSAEPIHKLYSWIPNGLNAEEIIFFPDACLGKSPLPTGTVVKTKQEDWRKFAVSDCGCGMLLAKSKIKKSEFDKFVGKLKKKHFSSNMDLQGAGESFFLQ